MSRPVAQLRNIGIVAHIDAGKTTVTERMLFYAHFSHRLGRVDSNDRHRPIRRSSARITINSACVTFLKMRDGQLDRHAGAWTSRPKWAGLRVLDGGRGVQREGSAQSETVWRQADRYHVALSFINKMDREGADFYGTVQEIEERLECRPIPVTCRLAAAPPTWKVRSASSISSR